MDRNSSHTLMSLGPALLPVLNGKGWRKASFSHPSHHMADQGIGFSSPALTSSGMTHSPAPHAKGWALLCFLDEVQCQFSHSHEPMSSSPTCHRLRGLEEGGGLLSLSHSTIWKGDNGAKSSKHFYTSCSTLEIGPSPCLGRTPWWLREGRSRKRCPVGMTAVEQHLPIHRLTCGGMVGGNTTSQPFAICGKQKSQPMGQEKGRGGPAPHQLQQLWEQAIYLTWAKLPLEGWD